MHLALAALALLRGGADTRGLALGANLTLAAAAAAALVSKANAGTPQSIRARPAPYESGCV